MATDPLRPAVELVALLASAGGLDSLSIVLRDLSAEFPAAVVVHQHLGGHSSVLPMILAERTPHRVDWARDGQVVGPGRVLVCPPGMHMELKPDGSCCLRKIQAPREQRFDVLLASVASSYGRRSVGVVLSGLGRDGAKGTAAMKRVGAVVIAESPDTAEFPSMPIAAAQAGADLVLPNYEIGRVLADIIEGAPLPQPRPRETDRAATSLEPPMEWAGEQTDPNTAGREAMGDATAAHHRGTRMSPNHTVNSPGARAEAAGLRAAELRRRRQDLAAGRGASAQTVATARRRAEESLRRAQLAHQAAEYAAARQAD